MTFVPYDRPVRAAFVGLGRIYDLNMRGYVANPDVEVVARTRCGCLGIRSGDGHRREMDNVPANGARGRRQSRARGKP